MKCSQPASWILGGVPLLGYHYDVIMKLEGGNLLLFELFCHPAYNIVVMKAFYMRLSFMGIVLGCKRLNKVAHFVTQTVKPVKLCDSMTRSI